MDNIFFVNLLNNNCIDALMLVLGGQLELF